MAQRKSSPWVLVCFCLLCLTKGLILDFLVGFQKGNDPSTVLCFKEVGYVELFRFQLWRDYEAKLCSLLNTMTRVQDEVVANFQAKLKGYTMTDYQETEILKASIQSATVRWTIDMADASAPTEYDMKYNTETGVFSIIARGQSAQRATMI